MIDRLRQAMLHPTNGIVGLADELMAVAWEQKLCLSWSTGYCRVELSQSGEADVEHIPLSKAVFRALVARFAGLCGEATSAQGGFPYSGEGFFTTPHKPSQSLSVRFTNTPEVQTLQLTRGDSSTLRESLPSSEVEPNPSVIG